MSDPHPLDICLRILSGLGESGEIVWELGKHYVERRKNPLTQEERLAYLRKAIAWLRVKAEDNRKTDPMWRTLPVDFRTFVDSPRLLAKSGVLWASVMREGEELNSGKYTESVLTGGIGSGKTTLAIYTQVYQVFILSCMVSPHEVFDLDPSSEIMIVIQSVNKNLAQDVDYKRLRDMVSTSPYFAERFPFQKDRESDMRFPRNVILKPVAGHDGAALGQNVIGGIQDEVNFQAVVQDSKMTVDGSIYDQAVSNYNAIASRRQSRFMQLGYLPGMLCLVSSRNYPGQFTDRKEREAKTNPRIFVYDKRIWDLVPERFSFHAGVSSPVLVEQYGSSCPLTFDVFVGDETRRPRILQPGEQVSEGDRHLVIWVPQEFRDRFDADILEALRAQAGVATQAIHPYMMNTDAITACFGRAQSIASRDECDFVHTRVQLYPKRVRNSHCPRFCHIDLGITKNSAGVTIGHVPRFVKVKRGDIQEMLPEIHLDLVLEVTPPRGGEIEFDAIRRLLYAVREIGVPLRWITADSPYAKDTIQILTRHGFVAGYMSLDTDTAGYDVTRQAIYDHRLLSPAHPKAQRELATLEIDAKHEKVNHNPLGSKDVADSIAGVVYGLTMRREIWTMHGVSLRDMPASITAAAGRGGSGGREGVSYKERLRAARGDKMRDDRLADERAGRGFPVLVREDT